MVLFPKNVNNGDISMKSICLALCLSMALTGCSTLVKPSCNTEKTWDSAKQVYVYKEVCPPPVIDDGQNKGMQTILGAIAMALVIGVIYKTAPKEAYK